MATEPRATTFVTGAAGFIGSELVKVLVARRHRVFGLTDSLEAAGRVRRAGGIPVMGDLLEAGSWQDEAAADWVFHVPPHAVHGPRLTRRRAASITRARTSMDAHLNVFPIVLPPLRERADDIPSLATHFLEQAAQRYGRRGPRLTERAIRMLQGYPWPGNVRELQHVIERAVLRSRGGMVRIDDVLAEPAETAGARSAPSTTTPAVIPEVQWRRREQENLGAALQLAKGRIYGPDGAADVLGVKPTTLISRLKALGLRDPRKRSGRSVR